MKEKLLGMFTSLLGGGFMLVVSQTQSFIDASGNSLMIVLLLFACAMGGWGAGVIATMVFFDEKPKKKGKKALDEKFIGEDF